MIRFWPGTHPRRRIPGPNATIPVLGFPGESTPTRYTRPLTCAATSRAEARRQPEVTAPMKVRRFIAWPAARLLLHHAPLRDRRPGLFQAQRSDRGRLGGAAGRRGDPGFLRDRLASRTPSPRGSNAGRPVTPPPPPPHPPRGLVPRGAPGL